MRKITLVLAALMTLSCSDGPPLVHPTQPTTVAVTAVEITGPATIAPGTAVKLAVSVKLADGTSKVAESGEVQWLTSDSGIVQVASTGVATASQRRGEVHVTARYRTSSQVLSATREIVVLPDGTFRLVGLVRDSEDPPIPLVGARVEVPSESGVATTTSPAGEYRLYGVPPNAIIQVSRASYTPLMQPVQLTDHATRDFALVLSGPRLRLGGDYTVVMDMPGGCLSGPGVTPDLRRRVYEATVTQSGALVEVVLVEPRFRTNNARRGNRFTGHADATGVRFTFESYDSYYYPNGLNPYPSVAEQLPDETVFVPQGEAIVVGSADAVSGGFNATFEQYDKTFPSSRSSLLGHCKTPLTQLTLTRR